MRLAVLRHQHDAVVERVAGPVEPQDIAADLDASGGDRVGAGDRAHEFGAAGADNSGDAEHFAGPDREADVLERAIVAGQALDLDQRRRRRRRLDVGKHPVERSADHLLDQRLDRNLRVVVVRHQPSVAQHRDPVGDTGDLVEPVTDVDEADAFGFQTADLLEQALGFLAPERRGRLVEDQEARIQGQRLGDFDLLLGGDPEMAHLGGGGDVEPQAMQLLGRAPVHEVAIDAAATHRQPADKNILGNRQIENEPHLLMDEADTGGKRVSRRIRGVGLAPPGHHSGSRRHESGDDRCDGRFSGAVLPDESKRLAGPDHEIDVAEDGDRPIILADSLSAIRRGSRSEGAKASRAGLKA